LEKCTPSQEGAYTKVSWLMGSPFLMALFAGLPDFSVAVFWNQSPGQNLPNYSYGLAGDFEPKPGTPLPLKYTSINYLDCPEMSRRCFLNGADLFESLV